MSQFPVMAPPVDVLIMTIIRAELDAVRLLFDLEKFQGPSGLAWGARLDSEAGGRHSVVAVRPAEKGTLAAMGKVTRALREWQPRRLLVVGIAGGVSRARPEMGLGDIVLGSEVVYYELQKHTPGAVEFQYTPLAQVDQSLKEVALLALVDDESWSDGLALPDGRAARAVPGKILTGDKLLGDAGDPALLELLGRHPDALAVEMESGGVARAVHEHENERKVAWLTVRAVSDFCDRAGNQETRDKWRVPAARSAATAALRILHSMRGGEARVDGVVRTEGLQCLFTDSSVDDGPDFTIMTRVVRASSTAPMCEAELLDLISRERRVVLRGPAGSGKSRIARRLSRQLAERDANVMCIDLRDGRASELNERLARALSSNEFDSAMDALLRIAPEDVTLSAFRSSSSTNLTVCFLDGLNEQAGIARHVIDTLHEEARQHPRIHFVVMDRMELRSDFDSRWCIVDVLPLEPAVVRSAVQGVLGSAEYDRLSPGVREVLTSPYFLSDALVRGRLDSLTRTDVLQRHLDSVIKDKGNSWDALAEHAHHSYVHEKSVLFPYDAFRSRLGESAEILIDSGIVEQAGNDRGRYRHQLLHDFLASRHALKRGPAAWDHPLFDDITLQGQSFDALAMLSKQITTVENREKLLERVHDWNWWATLSLLSELSGHGTAAIGVDLEVAIVAVVKAKCFDPIEDTRERARAACSRHTIARDSELLRAESLEKLERLARLERPSEWFDRWYAAFTGADARGGGALKQLLEADSLIGWARANSMRRRPLTHDESLSVVNYFDARNGPSPADCAIRWRCVHALAASESVEVVSSLGAAAATDSYHWVRYGALRSLVEIAVASQSGAMREAALVQLRDVPLDQPRARAAAGRALFHDRLRPDAVKAAREIMTMVRGASHGVQEQERWSAEHARLEEKLAAI